MRAQGPVAGRPDPRRALGQYRRLAAVYDDRTGWLQTCRHRAVSKLALRPGQVVVDVGCGSGLCFASIERAIGPAGRLIGIEPCPELRARAAGRVADHGWANVTLVAATAQEAELPERPEAVLFAFTHDVLRSPAALANVLGQARPAARVAAAGPKWSLWAPWLNLATWYVAREFVTTFEGFARPWSELAGFVPELRVEPAWFDTVYVAWGPLDPSGSRRRTRPASPPAHWAQVRSPMTHSHSSRW